MESVASVEAQSRFGELLERAQRAPIAVTRHGRTVAFVVAPHDMPGLTLTARREQASRWYAEFANASASEPAHALSDDDVTQLVHELR